MLRRFQLGRIAFPTSGGLHRAGVLNNLAGPSAGSGALNARWHLALEKAQERAGVNFDIRYIAASQTASSQQTVIMLRAQKDVYAHFGEDPAAQFGGVALALANYWGSGNGLARDVIGDFTALDERGVRRLDEAALVEAWEARIDEGRELAITTLRDHFLNPSEAAFNAPDAPPLGSLGWILRQWKEHLARAETYGVTTVLAYEGGASLELQGYAQPLRNSESFVSVWKEFLWGEEGAAVTRAGERCAFRRISGDDPRQVSDGRRHRQPG